MPGTDRRGKSMLYPGTMASMHRGMMGMMDGGARMPRHMMKIMFAIVDADRKPAASPIDVGSERVGRRAAVFVFRVLIARRA